MYEYPCTVGPVYPPPETLGLLSHWGNEKDVGRPARKAEERAPCAGAERPLGEHEDGPSARVGASAHAEFSILCERQAGSPDVCWRILRQRSRRIYSHTPKMEHKLANNEIAPDSARPTGRPAFDVETSRKLPRIFEDFRSNMHNTCTCTCTAY